MYDAVFYLSHVLCLLFKVHYRFVNVKIGFLNEISRNELK